VKLNADSHIWMRILRQLKRGIKRNVFIVLIDLVYEGNIQRKAYYTGKTRSTCPGFSMFIYPKTSIKEVLVPQTASVSTKCSQSVVSRV
jgi:hypothetical protein